MGGASSTEDSGESKQERAIQRIHGRKRKAKSDSLDVQTFLHHQRELLKEYQDSEHDLQQHKLEAFEKCMKASQEAEERPPRTYLSPPSGGPVMPTPSVSVPQRNLTQANLQPQQSIPQACPMPPTGQQTLLTAPSVHQHPL
ncbi:hypothetical protein Q8A67_007283 [Cirrhinus molitorella]|uniref:Uncharacterized protein n=1 Tax=Cirrhinus molitorella TaxID=172907 RepID=A0AA88TRL3_9TELE|nr:hypothetical protein Q8A67_007283 [Cirrhinus molitorella]